MLPGTWRKIITNWIKQRLQCSRYPMGTSILAENDGMIKDCSPFTCGGRGHKGTEMFYSVLFGFICILLLLLCWIAFFFLFFPPFFWIQETQKTNYYFMHLLWIIKFFCICICQYYIICILYWSVFMSDTEFEWILSSSCKPERERERIWPQERVGLECTIFFVSAD